MSPDPIVAPKKVNEFINDKSVEAANTLLKVFPQILSEMADQFPDDPSLKLHTYQNILLRAVCIFQGVFMLQLKCPDEVGFIEKFSRSIPRVYQEMREYILKFMKEAEMVE